MIIAPIDCAVHAPPLWVVGALHQPDRPDKFTPNFWAPIVTESLRRVRTPDAARSHRRNLPYALHQIDGDPTRLIVVNRFYKPVGEIDGWRMCDYERFVGHHVDCDVADALLHAGIVEDVPDVGFFFYHDANYPWLGTECLRAYRKKIEGLMGIAL